MRGKLSAAGRPGTKKRGDKDLTAVGAAGWSLRGLNLSADGEGRVGELCALLPTECVPLQTNTHTHAHTQTNISTSRQHAGSTPTPPEHRAVWRNAGRALPTCAPLACVKETLSSSSWFLLLFLFSWITGIMNHRRDIMDLWIKLVLFCCCCLGANADFHGR